MAPEECGHVLIADKFPAPGLRQSFPYCRPRLIIEMHHRHVFTRQRAHMRRNNEKEEAIAELDDILGTVNQMKRMSHASYSSISLKTRAASSCCSSGQLKTRSRISFTCFFVMASL
jgi:hypothetical protein